jgi:preprotein translocase subunit SecB
VDVQLNVHAEPVQEGLYEVSVTATVTTKVNDKTCS